MQTAVTMDPVRARAGQAAHAFGPESLRSMAAEGAVAFGLAVVEGTTVLQGKVPSADTQVFAGFAAQTQAIESTTGSVAPGYADDQAMSVMNFGAIWVKTMDTNLPSVNGTVCIKVGTSDAGKLTSTTTSNINITTKIVVREVDTTNKLALVEFREKV